MSALLPRRVAARLAVLTAAVLAAAILPAVTIAPASAAPGSLFTPLPGFVPPAGDRARMQPREAAAHRVDLAAVRARLAQAPSEAEARAGAAPLLFSVPDPAGRPVSFRVQESPVMERALARRHPEIRTYAGVGVTDPTTTIRLDVTPMGFHASVRGPSGVRSWYVDPAYNERGATTHLSYLRTAVPELQRPLVEADMDAVAEAAGPDPRAGESPGELVQLRTYRLALVTDPSYAEYFGTENVLAEKVTLMNRVNQIYNDDLAIRMLLVDGTEDLNLDTAAKATGPNGPCGANPCYDPADLGPESPGCTGALLDRTEFVLGQIIGAENFDIGHIGLGINGGGIAGLGVVGEQYKADGCTGLPFPEGDFFAIDYVAHEMGHQFAGNHTFNGSTGACSLTNRNPETSVEPGSGSSVMAYAGICGRDDLQPHSDPYFSQLSIDEITAHVTSEPNVYDEQQVVNLQGFDAEGESFQLTYPGADPVTLTRGPTGTYNTVGIAAAVEQLTGVVPEVTGYDGELNPGPAGFTLDFSSAGAGTDILTLGVVGVSSDVTGFVGTIYNGGPGTNQGVASPTGNHAPSVAAPMDKTIPIRTPFALTATGSDVDGQSLVYLWEQNDVGSVAPSGAPLMSNSKTGGPLFRVFGEAADVSFEDSLESPSPGINLADGNPSRTFPDLEQVLVGNTNAATGSCPAPPADPEAEVPQATIDCYSEFLPTSGYASSPTGGELNFRVTARDLVAAGGGTAHDDVTLTLSTAGPFLVTSRPASGIPAQGGATETVTWAVNGTNAEGLAPDVRIRLSTDGGQTYPHVLVASTPNDGSQAVILPDVTTDQARLKIEAVANYFFDVNDANFTIQSPLSLSDVAAQTVQYSDAFGSPVTTTATSQGHDGDELTAAVSGVDGLTVTRGATSADGVRPGTAEFTVAGPVTAAPGAREAVVTVTQPGRTAETSFPVTVAPEDASVTWTGPTEVATDQPTATVELATTVTDPDDGSRGDVTDATVSFVDRDTDEVLCSAPVTGGPLTGSASCEAELASGAESTTYTIGTVVGGHYLRDDAADDTDVVVRSDTGAPDTEITGGPEELSYVLSPRTTLTFSGDEPGVTYRCGLDGRRVACSDGTVTLRGLSTKPHVFRVAARDAAGNVDPTPAVRRFISPYNDSQLDRRGGWDRRHAASAYRGDWLRASTDGATLTRRLDEVTRIALVVGKSPGYGRVAVFFDGRRIDTVSLDANRVRGKVVVPVAEFDDPQSGLLRIETLDGRTVRIEGLGAG